MRVVIQRVSRAIVRIPEHNYIREIETGFVILLGIKNGDTEEDVHFLADKCSNLRVFEDEQGKMNLSIQEINGSMLIISQFTLYGDAQRGNRPSFSDAARPEQAIPLYEKFVAALKSRLGGDRIVTGIFGAMMTVELTNEGPVTIIIESKEK
jgi:D-tyrosyl-tRNA(Tyr) deacylase